MGIFKKTKEKQSTRLADEAKPASSSSCQIGWLSPSYTESRCVELDPKTLEENRAVCLFPETPEADPYRVLRTQIQHRTREHDWKTVMITSARPGEGKTLTAVNLALTFAREFDQTVLLVDSDLKRQRIHALLGYESGLGLGDYLLEDRPLKNLIVWPGIEKLTLISGGRTLHDSTELLGSPRMKALVDEMKHRYDNRYILFDAPAILSRSDALAFAPIVDCVLMVVEAGKTAVQDVKKAAALLPREKFLGLVLNRTHAGRNGYSY